MASIHPAAELNVTPSVRAGDDSIYLTFGRREWTGVESFAALSVAEARALAADLVREAHVTEARLREAAAAAAERVPA